MKRLLLQGLVLLAVLLPAMAQGRHFDFPRPTGWKETTEGGAVVLTPPSSRGRMLVLPEARVPASVPLAAYLDRLVKSRTRGAAQVDRPSWSVVGQRLGCEEAQAMVIYGTGGMDHYVALRDGGVVAVFVASAPDMAAVNALSPQSGAFFTGVTVATSQAAWSPDSAPSTKPSPTKPSTKPSPVRPTPTRPNPVATRPDPVATRPDPPKASAPTIEIVEPAWAADSRDLVTVPSQTDTVKVVGYAYGSSPISTVKVRGKSVPLTDAGKRDRPGAVRFETQVRLGMGRNALEIEAIDVDGTTGRRDLVLARRDAGPVAVTSDDLTQARKGKRWALLIGVARYDNAEFKPLRYCLEDVEALRRALRASGVADSNVRLLAAGATPPTKINVEKAMHWLTASAAADDTVLIYVSGHGVAGTRGSYLLTQDSDPAALLSTALSTTVFNKLVAGIPARKKIVVLDACHSGGVSLAARGDAPLTSRMREDMLAQHDRAEGEARLMSCKENEQSFESDEPDIRQGVFTYYLVKGMGGAADANHDGFVTFAELQEYVKREVHAWAAARGKSQNPVADTRASGVIVVTEVRK